MSGILGLWYRDARPVEGGELKAMVESLAHRGPDGSGSWSDKSVGLGHRKLAITPWSLSEALPASDASGQLVITADVRLDNREELKAALDVPDSSGFEVSDSDLILKAYERWGERCPERLLGDFAFAIWDGRNRSLFCARDHMGLKPFYYYLSPNLFTFASEIKALLCLPEVPRRLNETRVADYLTPMLQDNVITFYKDIFRLPAGHSMVVSRERAEVTCYWSLDPAREVRLGSNEEYDEAFRELFLDSVRCRLPSAHQVGSLLSGGLDSSSIACAARDMLKESGELPLKTFSAIFEIVTQCDERHFIDIVLEQGGFEPHYVVADSISPLTDYKRIFFHQDEPFFAPNLFMHCGLYEAAQGQGVRALLDGVDGDTTVSYGTKYFVELASQLRLATLAKEVRLLSGLLNDKPWRVLWRYSIKNLAPDSLRPAWRRLRGVHRLGFPVNPDLREDFARRIGLFERLEAQQGKWQMPARTTRDEHYRRLTWGLIPFILEAADKAAAMYHLEVRYPFFDKRLVEFCLGLPSEQKFSEGWVRVIQRRALEDIMPRDIAWRFGKSCLGANFRRGIRTDDRELIEDAIFKDPGGLANYIDINALRATYHRFREEESSREDVPIWRAATFGLWLHHTGMQP